MAKIHPTLKAFKELQQAFQALWVDNTQLKEENAYLKFQLKELQDKIYKKKSKKIHPSPPTDKPLPKKRGAPFGHLGWFRKKPDRVGCVEEVRLKQCL
jgi:regulator of replication initiation timing